MTSIRPELFIEWSQSTSHTAAFVKELEINNFKGFRSYFKYDKQLTEIIQKNRSVADIDMYPVYSDYLFIDIDTGDTHIEQVDDILKTMNLTYEKYLSGSKGVHYHIPLNCLYTGIDLPARHKQWVSNNNIPADMSIYKHTGLFRLPKTKHKKTQRLKELIDINVGFPLVLPELEKPLIIRDPYTEVSLSQGLFQACGLAIEQPSCGNRHMQLWSMVQALKDAEFSRDFSFEMLIQLNNSWTEQKDISDLQRIIKDVYKGE